MLKKKFFFWSPFTDRVATVKSVINSAESLTKYSNGFIQTTIIDAVGEWQNDLEEIKRKKINIISLNNSSIFKKFSKRGFIRSRIAYWFIFFSCFKPLIKLLKKEKPDYLIIHLITSLPMIVFTIFNLNIKLILRISGFPKLNFFRKLIWNLVKKKVNLVFCPTIATTNYIKNLNFFENKNVYLLRDPIIKVREIVVKKNSNSDIETIKNKNYLLSIGRLTRQKNFLFLIDCFNEIANLIKDLDLIIIGEGEEKEKILSKIKKYSLQNRVFLENYKNNVFKYFKYCKCFILSSLWEDPGFVLVEAAFCNKPIISSNCFNGPSEFLHNGKGGFLYESNSKDDFVLKFNEFLKIDKHKLNKKLILSKKEVKKYTFHNHYIEFKKIINL